MPLTELQVKQAKTDGKTQKLSDGGGMYLEITPKGAKYWRLKYRFAGKENRLSLGVYPAVSLKAARELREDARKLIATGNDPSQDRKAKKAIAATSADNTFKAIALEWHGIKKASWSEVHTKTTMERMENNIFPWLGSRPLEAIEAPELLATLRRVEARGAIDTAHRVKTIMNGVYQYAIATGRATRNPAADVGAGLKTVLAGHHAAITDPVRVGQLMRDIDAYTGSNVTRSALKIHALTFQRPNEISYMAWSEIDVEAATWTIPPHRMKGSVKKKAASLAHVVPLSRQAVAVLADLRPLTGHGALAFPSERGQGRAISENTVRQALRTMGYTDHTPHGFRATVRTLAREQLRIDKEVIERQLAHGSDEELGGAYDRTQFLADRVKLMQEWADYLDKLRVGADVIQLKIA